jgi:pimeloyl-ACP methyl ester carboxylesterase
VLPPPGAGRPLLLLHSINAAPSAFEVSPFFDPAALERPLYAPDLPGFGRSERADRAYSPEFFATAIEDDRCDRCGPVDVLALSTTAEFAARAAAADAPERVASLVAGIADGDSAGADAPSAAGRGFTAFPPAGLSAARSTGPAHPAEHALFPRHGLRGRGAGGDGRLRLQTTAQPGASMHRSTSCPARCSPRRRRRSVSAAAAAGAGALRQDPNISFDYLDEVLEAAELAGRAHSGHPRTAALREAGETQAALEVSGPLGSE